MGDDKTPTEDLDSTQTFEQESGPPQSIGNYRFLQKLINRHPHMMPTRTRYPLQYGVQFSF